MSISQKEFSLENGRCLTEESLSLRTYPVKVENDQVFVDLASPAPNEAMLAISGGMFGTLAYWSAGYLP